MRLLQTDEYARLVVSDSLEYKELTKLHKRSAFFTLILG